MDNNSKKVPGYVAFATALAERFEAAGVPLVPVKTDEGKDGLRGPADWVLFEVKGTGDKVYANRTANGIPTKIETTVPFDDLPAAIVQSDQRGKNGKIEARLLPDIEALAASLIPALARRVAEGATIRPNKRAAKQA